MYQFKRPYSEFIDFKQDFIDMVVYDIKLLNPDRGLENWFIRQNKSTKAIDLYPMFDNEMILGFDRQITEFEFSSDQLKYEISKTTSAILTPEAHFKHKRNADYNELFKYLLKKYPIQTQNSLRKFSNCSFKKSGLSGAVSNSFNSNHLNSKFSCSSIPVNVSSLNIHSLSKTETLCPKIN